MSMKLIKSLTATGAEQYLDFNNIPQNYTDLMVIASVRNTASTDSEIYITINTTGGSGTAINNQYLQGTGAAASAYTLLNNAALFQVAWENGTHTANIFANMSVYMSNYASSTTKSFSIESVGENNAAAAKQVLHAGNIVGTTPITSFQVIAANAYLSSGSTISLYGITKGSGGATVV